MTPVIETITPFRASPATTLMSPSAEEATDGQLVTGAPTGLQVLPELIGAFYSFPDR